MKNCKQGVFITFEGGEGAGKTTLIEQIARQLSSEGYPVLKTREPGGTKLGEYIRTILLQHNEPVSPYAEFSLFLASRAQHIFEIILPALQAKKIVLCDRFNDSSVAYQGAARGLGVEKVAEVCQFMSEGLQADLTFYLDIEPKLGLARAAKTRNQDRIESERIDFHNKIREAYLQIYKANRHRFHLLDASGPAALVYDEAIKWLHQLLSIHV